MQTVSAKKVVWVEGHIMSREILPNLFVIGMPRSGTKLLRALLNNHTSIYIPDIETAFIPGLVRKYGGRELTASEISGAANEIKNSLFCFYYSKKNDFRADRLILRPGCTIFDILRAFYKEICGFALEGFVYIGDKTPRNIYSAELLANAFPVAKYIHIVRDPRDYALSVKKAWGKNELRAVFRWVEGISVFQNAIVSAKKQFIEVRYEDLLLDPESTVRKCTDFLGLGYERDMMRLPAAVESVGDARYPVIKRDNAGKYRQDMSPAQIRKIDDYTVELLHRYGYHCSSNRRYNKPASSFMEGMLRLMDACSLFGFHMRQHGFREGLERIRKASK